ncbi:MAG: response regulator [Sandaracinaceae bacterium]|nr:response regulator [Sandaracinaceae bacterium]
MPGSSGRDASPRWGAILDAVARVADHLRAAPSVAEAMPQVLAVLGHGTGVSRVYVFEHVAHDRDDARIRQRFEWCAPGVEPQIDNPDLQDADLGAMGFDRWVRELTAGRPVFGDVADFPASERPLLEAQAIHSVLVQPIFSGSYWWGFIGFDACERPHAWQAAEADTLRVAAQMCGMALALESREAHARHAYKMEALGRMAGGIAHDFNNLLAVMHGNVELLRRDAGLAGVDPGRRLVELEQAIDQAARLTRELLDFGRPRDEAAPVTAPLEALRALEPLLRRVAGPDVRLDLDALGDVAPVRMAPSRLEQIVLNLVSNARDAMPAGGTLQLRLRTLEAAEALVLGDVLAPGEYTLISVRDSGHGIPAELRERVFEPFFTTKELGQGTGLGLSTVYGAVSAASGALRLTSSASGTELRVYLPAERASATPLSRAASEPAPAPGHGERILVCDDNAASLEWIAQVLHDAGYRVLVDASATGCLAREEVARGEIDLLLTDVRMAPIDGPTLAAELRERMGSLPCVFMSGFTANLLTGLREEDTLLDKPFTRAQLLSALARALREGR